MILLIYGRRYGSLLYVFELKCKVSLLHPTDHAFCVQQHLQQNGSVMKQIIQ